MVAEMTKNYPTFGFIGNDRKMSTPLKLALITLEDEPNIPDPAEAPVVMDAAPFCRGARAGLD
jgi:hypothetical protein